MKISFKIVSLLALLFMGGASLMAQDTDPFPDVKIGKYQGSMTITAQVRQNGEIVTDAVVAVFCESELRGKGSVGNGTNPDLAFLTVYGDNTTYDQYLYFKVYTDGHIFTCNPNPAMKYIFYAGIGTLSTPYVIDITPVSLDNASDNSETLTTWNTKTCDVVLSGRTLTKNGEWNTLCLPFNVDDISTSPLASATIMELNTTDTNLDDAGKLTLRFNSAPSIVAGKPYLIKWESGENLDNPVFTGVTINYDAPMRVTSTDGKVTFVGHYSPFSIDEGNRSEIIMMSTGNRLGYSQNARSLKCFRCHFEVPSENGESTARTIVLLAGDEEEGVTEIRGIKEAREDKGDAWWTLSGTRLNGKPTVSGTYIHNGKKKVIR